MILLHGSEGNMGKRYQAIFNYLNFAYVGIDKDDEVKIEKKYHLIATPTDTHADIIEGLLEKGDVQILCEKPICKDLERLERLLEKAKGRLAMVNQYSYLPIQNTKSLRPTSYDYFKHGYDGIGWDCIQILGLANSSVSLNNESPVWRCSINGKKVNLSDMDSAYITMVHDWINTQSRLLNSKEEILRIHKLAAQYQKAHSLA